MDAASFGFRDRKATCRLARIRTPASACPEDTYWLEGHDGQSVAVIPSKNLVVVRMGLTPSELGYRPQALVAAAGETDRIEASLRAEAVSAW